MTKTPEDTETPTPRMWAIYVLGDALGMVPMEGWLSGYDLEARDGRGSIMLSANELDAIMWDSPQAALRAYGETSKTRPLRDDGKPNRPLRGYTVQLCEVRATIVRSHLARQKG